MLVDEAEEVMAEYMKNYDPSHDIYHVRRVRKTAEKLAASVHANLLVVQLGAIFHDLVDHKYQAKGGGDISVVRELLQKHSMPQPQIEEVVKIVESVGYSRERKLKAAGEWTDWHETNMEFRCVQDADRLDAMGAIGMFRVAAYSAIIDEPLYIDSSRSQPSAYEHTHTKLLKLQKTLRVPLAQKFGARRHAFMLEFVRQLDSDLEDI